MFAGWLAAILVGVVVGAAIASSRAVLPPAILVLGLSDAMIVFVVAFGSVWPILLGAIHGFKSLDPRLADVARMLKLSPWQRALKFQLPNALPDIFAGMRVSIAIALIITSVSSRTARCKSSRTGCCAGGRRRSEDDQFAEKRSTYTPWFLSDT